MRVLDETHIAITRVEMPDRQLLGWVVRLSHEGKAFRRYFSDKKHRGRKAAYQAARRFVAHWGERAEVRALLLRLNPRRNTRSGIPGVARYEGQHGRGPYWLAYWNEGCRMVQKRFAVSVHGEDKARELAIATRERGMKPYAERLEEIRQRDAYVLLSLLPDTEDEPQVYPSRGSKRG